MNTAQRAAASAATTVPADTRTADGTGGRFARNVRWLTLSNILYRLVSVGVAVYLARGLGASVLGQYATVTNILTLYLSFADLGITNLVIRDVSRDRTLTQSHLDTFFSLQLVSSLVLAALALLTGMLSGYNAAVQSALLLGTAGLVAGSLATVYNGLLSAHERIYPFAVIEIACMLVFLAGNLAVVLLHAGLFALIGVTVLVSAVKLALGALWARRCGIVLRGRPSLRLARSLLMLGLPFLLINGAHFAVQRLDVLFLSWTAGEAGTGVYAAASRLVFASLFFVSAVGTSLYPVFSRLLTGDRARAEGIHRTGTVLLVALACTGAILFRGLAPVIVRVMYGARFADAAGVLGVLVFFIPLFAWGLLASNVLMTGGRAWHAVWVSVAGLAVMAAGAAPLISLLGIRGAALAVVCAETVSAAGYVHFAGRMFGSGVRGTWRAAAVIAVFAACTLGGDLLPEGAGAAAAIAVFIAALPLFRLVTHDDLRTCRALLGGAAA